LDYVYTLYTKRRFRNIIIPNQSLKTNPSFPGVRNVQAEIEEIRENLERDQKLLKEAENAMNGHIIKYIGEVITDVETLRSIMGDKNTFQSNDCDVCGPNCYNGCAQEERSSCSCVRGEITITLINIINAIHRLNKGKRHYHTRS